MNIFLNIYVDCLYPMNVKTAEPTGLKFYVGHDPRKSHYRSLEVIRRSNTGFVAATVFLGFLAFN